MEPGPRGQVSPGETRCQSCATQDSGCCTEASSLGVESSGQSGDTNFSGAPRRSSEFGAGVYGCAHYRRRCKIVAPCCGEIFWCRHCHNESKNIDEKDPKLRHEVERKKVQEVVCAVCDFRQPVAKECTNCGVEFGAYSCLTCKFFDDDTTKQQYHCDECGICRVGGRSNFFHCQTCGCCYALALRDSHACIQDSMRSNCPVCQEFLFDSIKPISVLRCGHTMHESCLHHLRMRTEPGHPSSYTCPTCSKCIYDMKHVWMEMDHNVAANPMAPEYRGLIVKIACKDCQHKSEVPFHIWLKCQSCGSYNTRRT